MLGSPYKIFIYTERNDNLGLYVIQDVIKYAFLNNTFDSEHIKRLRDIWDLIKVLKYYLSTPIHFKKSVKDTPIFRRAMKNNDSVWIIDPQYVLDYSKLAEYKKSISCSAGYKEKGTLYKYHKGATTNIRETLLWVTNKAGYSPTISLLGITLSLYL
ncbi:uncharacterized protein N7459_006480 [Penicillium hispanicum]|uniref:uncharacterized protein n=1 Tax=Penicillium hispanicum TaxID=1080232 RepID=UPI002541B487|nr:uncharacterized protein N7459_006480 [Penicillium hispanicum]KAJ5577516.1 hypothetical protein N7459_006480 [Penicillium hispanicum]